MIYLIHGANAYTAEQELQKITSGAGLEAERIEADGLSENALADIVRGGSLFSEKRLVVVRQLSANKPVFDTLASWANEVTSDTTLVLLEAKLDKRTKAYKTIIKAAKVINATPLTERERGLAEEWLGQLARQHKVKLSPAQVRNMIDRTLVPGEGASTRIIDQMQLAKAIQTLKGTNEVADEAIATILPPAVSDTVFDLLDLAARANTQRAEALLTELARTEDPHKTLALVMGQWAQLVGVALADGPSASIATELGIHPFVAKKLQELARHFTSAQLKSLTQLAADIDAGAKLSQFSPADGVYRFIHAILYRKK